MITPFSTWNVPHPLSAPTRLRYVPSALIVTSSGNESPPIHQPPLPREDRDVQRGSSGHRHLRTAEDSSRPGVLRERVRELRGGVRVGDPPSWRCVTPRLWASSKGTKACVSTSRPKAAEPQKEDDDGAQVHAAALRRCVAPRRGLRDCARLVDGRRFQRVGRWCGSGLFVSGASSAGLPESWCLQPCCRPLRERRPVADFYRRVTTQKDSANSVARERELLARDCDVSRAEIESALERAEYLVASVEGHALSPRILELRERGDAHSCAGPVAWRDEGPRRRSRHRPDGRLCLCGAVPRGRREARGDGCVLAGRGGLGARVPQSGLLAFPLQRPDARSAGARTGAHLLRTLLERFRRGQEALDPRRRSQGLRGRLRTPRSHARRVAVLRVVSRHSPAICSSSRRTFRSSC